MNDEIIKYSLLFYQPVVAVPVPVSLIIERYFVKTLPPSIFFSIQYDQISIKFHCIHDTITIILKSSKVLYDIPLIKEIIGCKEASHDLLNFDSEGRIVLDVLDQCQVCSM